MSGDLKPEPMQMDTTKSRAKQYKVPYGKTELAFELPPGMHGTLLVSGPVQPLADVEGDIAEALTSPVGSQPLREMIGQGDAASLTVCIVFTDITRASPDHLLVPPVLDELAAADVRTLARVAAFIPKKPAKTELSAPRM